LKITRDEVLASQKKIYQHMKKKALRLEGESSQELKDYQKDQQRYASRSFNPSDIVSLLQSIEQSKIVYLGDFHTFDQSSKNLERLIRAVTKEKKKLVLGVELVHIEHQKTLNQFLERNITEQEFLENINYGKSWRFPWIHYKKFFDLAKKEQFHILALNSVGTLPERDQTAAHIISTYVKNNPDSTALILFGELHIMLNKLPSEVEKMIGPKVNQTIIHQNLDDVYWKIQESSPLTKEQTQIVKFNNFEYSLQTSPPWIKYESMIYWYENLLDDPDFDIHEYIMQTGIKSFTSNIQENFVDICYEVLNALNIHSVLPSEVEDFNLYDHNALPLILDKVNNLSQSNIKNFLKYLIMEGESFKIPTSHDYYCSNYSVNRIALLAGIHIHYIHWRKHTKKTEDQLFNKGQTEKFIFLFYQNLVSYLSSKIFNPYMKCDLYVDFKNNPKPNHLVLNILDQLTDTESSLKIILANYNIKKIYSAAKSIGHFIAETIYEDHYRTEGQQFSLLKENILHIDLSEQHFNKLILILFKDESFKKKQKRFF